MRVLGIDPGATSGWCIYDTDGRVLGAGCFVDDIVPHDEPTVTLWQTADRCVIERPRGYGPTRPQVVDCAWVAGRLSLLVQDATGRMVNPMERKDVRKQLQLATLGTVRVTNDASAWAALLLIHGGDDAGKKGGALHGVKSHARAALAVSVAYARLNAWLDDLPF